MLSSEPIAAQGTLDPTNVYTPIPIAILTDLVTRSLTQYAYDPASGGMTLIPDLATNLGTPNDDFTEWTFTIRDGVKYEDGTPVTAADVALGIERSFDRKAFPDGPTYSNDYFLDGDRYQGPYRSGTTYDGITVEGNTLTLKMAHPFPDLPYYASFPGTGPIPEQGRDLARYAVHPVATGPYKFAGDLSDTSLTLVRNPYWDARTDPGRHQYVDGFRFAFDTLSVQQVDATILGDTSAGATTISVDDPLPADYRRALQQDQLAAASRPCTHAWRPDFRDPVTSDIRVRKALGYAFPYDAYIAAKGLAFGITALRANTLLPPLTPGRLEYNVLGTDPGETDPRRARQLLAQAGYAPGEAEIKFAYETDDPYSVAAKGVLVHALERAGFKVSPRPTGSFEEFLAVEADPHAPINMRIGFGGWCAD
ncbi:MAG TPA: ABC transporter substrate-binding protein, partial [Nocardioidaceae bacterium]